MGKKAYMVSGILMVLMVALMVIFWRLSATDPAQGAGGADNGSTAGEDATANETSAGRASTDPQHLMIPRWFLTSLTLDGQEITVPEGSLSLQFEEGGNANGSGGCNNFFSQYQAEPDGTMQLGPVGATKMFCDGKIETENAYFEALAKVTRFKTEDWKLFLTSEDGKTALVFGMPPK